jgi:hypothetical protein
MRQSAGRESGVTGKTHNLRLATGLPRSTGATTATRGRAMKVILGAFSLSGKICAGTAV